MLDKSAQSGRAPLAEHRDDFYCTPPEAVRALLKAEKFSGTIWEPACGDGAIVNVLRDTGHRVYATDLVDRGCPDSESRVDFLMEQAPSFAIGAIVTNPPYALAQSGNVAAVGILREHRPLRNSRWRQSRPRLSIPQSPRKDAPAWMDRKAQF